MSNKVHIGIDPGKNGAIVVIDGDKVHTYSIPLIGVEYDITETYKLLLAIERTALKGVHYVVEDVHALQKPFDSGNWSLSACKSMLITILTVNELPFTLVAPKTWQKQMWLGIPEQREPSKTTVNKKGEKVTKAGKVKTKIMSEMAAKRLFPRVDLRDPNRKTDKAKSTHDGVVDALLMAEYSRRNFD